MEQDSTRRGFLTAWLEGLRHPDHPVARVDPSLCWAAKGQPCDYCYEYCPHKDKALRWVDGLPHVDARHCTGCGTCEDICTASTPAIRVDDEGSVQEDRCTP
jgi:Pyruvate/2-oxoacid:ferredoxin oxidoreductase delta subunit